MKLCKNLYDIVVVGAGPSGSTAAKYAAEKGLSVLVLERDREPGIPVRCAEAVSEKGLIKFIDPDEKWIAAKIDDAHLITPDGKTLSIYNKSHGYILERRLFDSALCELACKNGAELLTKADAVGLERRDNEKTRVYFKYFGKTEQVETKIVIAADGIESRVGRWAGINTNISPNEVASCLQYTLNNVEVEKKSIYFYFGRDIAPGGYLWVFPKSKNKANVGLGIPGKFAQEKTVKDYLDNFVEKYFPKSSCEYIVCGGVPTTSTLKKISTDGLMIVGDAARQVNPITGGGIIQGMVAGKLASLTAFDAITINDWSADSLKKYDKSWNDVLGKTQKFMCSMKDKVLTMKDERINHIAEMCRKIPQDKFTLTELFKQTVKGDPKLIAQMASAFVVSKLNL